MIVIGPVSELAIHIAIWYWLIINIKPDWRAWHSANGERHGDPRQGAKLKAMGVVKGAPDLTLVGPTGRVCFMEIKSETGALSADQEDWMLWCIRHNISHSVCRSLDDAQKVLRHWGCIKELTAQDAQS